MKPISKIRHWCLTLLFVTVFYPCFANLKSYTFDFSEEDFTSTVDSENRLQILLRNHPALYLYGTSNYAIPYIPFDIESDTNEQITNYVCSYDSILINTNCKLDTITDIEQIDDSQDYSRNLSDSKITDISLHLKTNQTIEGAVHHFIIQPFYYDISTQRLFLRTNIHLQISTKSLPNTAHFSIQDNTATIPCDTQTESAMGITPPIVSKSNIEYLIITNSELKNTFKKLADWKKQKGLYAEVVTINEIIQYLRYEDVIFDESQLPYIIKQYLVKIRKNSIRPLKYVLLGGDDSIVPARYCESKEVKRDNPVPSDYYYACLESYISWDSNNNGIYAEFTDSISFEPSIYVTRAPVRTISDTESFIRKILAYETNPIWNNKMLITGATMAQSQFLKDDTEKQGSLLYTQAIEPYWNGNLVKMFDTYSDIPSLSHYFTQYTLQNQLSKGYDFVSVIAHGNQTLWLCEGYATPSYYTSDNGMEQKNTGFTIISSTVSCHTNAFDTFSTWNSDPCLSEALIRNPNSGVIAYFGNSRSGIFGRSDTYLGLSLSYEAEFYRYMFSDEITDKNFGKIAILSKKPFIGICSYDKKPYDSKYFRTQEYRSQFLTLNPIGDPEMPVFTREPLEFTSASLKQTNNSISIDTGVENCRICIMGLGKSSVYRVFDNTSSAKLDNCPDSVSICITKQDYIPLVTKYKKQLLPNETLSALANHNEFEDNDPNEIISASYDKSLDAILINTSSDTSGKFKISIYNITNNQIKSLSLQPSNQQELIKCGDLPHGIYQVRIEHNGHLYMSKRFIK